MLLNLTEGAITVIQWGVVIGASLVAACFDLRQRRIPNALTFPLLIVGLVLGTWLGGLTGLAEAVGACVLLALPYVILFVFFGGGAGDAKLMGAIGAWLGLKHGLFVLICVIIAGGMLAIVKAKSKKQLKFVLTSVFVSIYTFILLLIGRKTIRAVDYGTNTDRKGTFDLPYGVAIFAGVCVAAVIVGMWGVQWMW